MEHGTKSQHSSMPLVSRLDHLDFIMKYLEGKMSLHKGMEKACLPFDSAMIEAYFKGSMFDRVTSLEHRLFQLCLDLESSASTSGYGSSSRGQLMTRSLPTFSTNSDHVFKHESRQPSFLTSSEIQEESETMLVPKKKDPNPLKRQAGNKKSNKKEKTCNKNGKKKHISSGLIGTYWVAN